MGINKTIKVCHLISGDLWAGAEVQAFNMIKSLDASDNIKIYAIVLNKGKLVDKLQEIDVNVKVFEESKLSFWQIYSEISIFLQDKQIDIIHSHRYKENLLGAMLKRKNITANLVQTVHGMGELFKGFSGIKAKVNLMLNKYCSKKYFDKIIAVSNDIQKTLIHKNGLENTTTIHNSINLEDIKTTKSKEEIRNELSINQDDFVIGAVGRMVPVKGYDVFIKAAKEISNQLPQVKFVLTGDGPMLSQLKELAKSIGLGDKIIFTGYRDDPYNIINALDIFVISSYHEGIPTVVLEAMALQKVIIATDVGGIPEIIEENESGLLVPSNDIKAITKAVMKIYDNEPLKTKLSTNGYDFLIKEYIAEVQYERIVNLYNELVGPQ